jgi:hypothetical protein
VFRASLPSLPADARLSAARASIPEDALRDVLVGMDCDPRSLLAPSIDLDARVAMMGEWLELRGPSLEPPSLDAALALLEATIYQRDLATWLALRILATLPKSLLWKAAPLWARMHAIDDGMLSRAARECVNACTLDARLPLLRWLSERGALELPTDAAAMHPAPRSVIELGAKAHHEGALTG